MNWVYASASFKRVGLLGIRLDLCLGQFRRRPPTQGLTQALTRLVFSTLSQIGKIFFKTARVLLCPYQRGTKKYSDSIKCYDFTLSFMIYPKFYWSQKRNRCGGLFFMAINHLAIIFLMMNFASFSCEQLPKKISTSLECEWETCLRLRITPQVMSKKWSHKTGLTRRCTRPEVSFIFLHCA